jgi:hypothetical protein
VEDAQIERDLDRKTEPVIIRMVEEEYPGYRVHVKIRYVLDSDVIAGPEIDTSRVIELVDQAYDEASMYG